GNHHILRATGIGRPADRHTSTTDIGGTKGQIGRVGGGGHIGLSSQRGSAVGGIQIHIHSKWFFTATAARQCNGNAATVFIDLHTAAAELHHASWRWRQYGGNFSGGQLAVKDLNIINQASERLCGIRKIGRAHVTVVTNRGFTSSEIKAA